MLLKTTMSELDKHSTNSIIDKSIATFINEHYLLSMIISLLMIIIIGFASYSNIFDNSFHFDDTVWLAIDGIKQNDYSWLFSFNKFRIIPFATLTYNYYLFGNDPSGYYYFNLIIHILSSIIVFGVVLQIFKTPILKDIKVNRYALIIALFLALIFLTHPLQTQAVSYVYQRIASIVAFFYLLTIFLFFKLRLSKEFKKKFLYLVLTLLSFIAAIFSKENAFTLPITLLLVEVIFFHEKIRLRPLPIIFTFFIVIILLLLVNTISAYTIDSYFAEQVNYYNEIITPKNYLFTQFSVIVKYWRMLILPYGQHIDHYVSISNDFLEFRTITGFLINLTIIIFGFLCYRKYKLLSFGILFFYVTISIESSVIPISDMLFEHRLYLPMFGFLMIILQLVLIIKNKFRIEYILIFFSALVIFYAFLTFNRNRVWQNEGTLWTDTIRKSPNNARARSNRGLYFLKNKKYDYAIYDFTKSIELFPINPIAYSNRGIAYYFNNDLDKSLDDFNNAIKTDSISIKFFFDNIKSYYRTARRDMEKRNAVVYLHRANIYIEFEEYKLALKDLLKLNRIDPSSMNQHYTFGYCYMKLGELDKAIDNFLKYLEHYKKKPDVYAHLSNCYVEIGDYDKAIDILSEGIKENPYEFQLMHNRDHLIKTRQAKEN
jgi:tetratricopeptide (TPR) repeat protein